jgi:hypothetical protein
LLLVFHEVFAFFGCWVAGVRQTGHAGESRFPRFPACLPLTMLSFLRQLRDGVITPTWNHRVRIPKSLGGLQRVGGPVSSRNRSPGSQCRMVRCPNQRNTSLHLPKQGGRAITSARGLQNPRPP